MNTTATPSSIDLVPAWHRPDWNGPTVENRPEGTPDSAEWPKGAAERVTFTLDQFPDVAYPEDLPLVVHFGADDWPLCCPENVKPRLDPRMKPEFRAYPWFTHLWSERCWTLQGSDHDRFMRWNAQAGLIRAIAPAPPTP